MRFLVVLIALFATSTSQAGSPPDSLRVMPLGDSITHARGFVSEAQPGFAGYRYWLWKALEAEGYPVDFVGTQYGTWNGDSRYSDYDQDHEGHWGWRADEILAGIGSWTAATLPDVLLIHLGHNDFLQTQSIDSTIDELGQIIDAVRIVNPNATFLLAQVIPSAFASLDSIPPFNDRIPLLAAAKHSENSPVLVVDQSTGFDPWQHTYDGIHPNELGEQFMADRWLVPLQAILASVTDVSLPSSTTGNKLWLSSSPNPFNPTTEISFSVPAAMEVRVSIHTVTGRTIAKLWEGRVGPGDHTATWNGRDTSGVEVASGVYFVRVSSAHQAVTEKITLIK